MRITKTGARQFIYKTSLLQILALLLVPFFGVVMPQQASAFSGGTGVVDDPFEIATVADLLELNSYSGAAHVGKYFELTADIDLNIAPYNTGAGWTPLSSFQGHFDGNGHTISNLYINTTGSSKGLFVNLAGATEFKDVNLTNVSIATNGQNVGALAGTVSGRTVTNVTVSGTVSSTGGTGFIGGFAGQVGPLATLNNVQSNVNVTATSAFTLVGGLTGYMVSSTATSTSSTGTVAGGQYRVGGLIGDVEQNSTIRRSYATGAVSSSGGETGGLVGALYGDIEDSYSRSSVTSGNTSKGGLAGFINNANASIVRSYATGVVSGTGGGLLGGLYSGTCNSNFWDSQTTGRSTSACSGAGATAKTTSQMKDVATFTNTSTSTGLSTAWDFTGNPNNDSGSANYWNIDTNGVINDGYPYLNGYVANNAPVVSGLGAASLVDGSWSTNSAPTLEFTINDAEVADEASYQIQIDDSSNFASPVIDYTSGPKSQGSFNFVVGQTAGAGTSGVGSYTVGSAGQTLADGQYYWRVRATDSNAATGSYTTANSGAVAFGVDTTAPSVPTNFEYDEITNDNTPAIDWDNATDASGQAVSYLIQWSQAEDFSSIDSTTNSSSNFIPLSSLEDGTWYFRVKSYDPLGNESAYATAFSLVIDTAEPTVESLSPAHEAMDAGLADNLVVEFSEPVSVGTGDVEIRKSSNSGLVEAIDITSGQVSGDGTNTLTINPSDPFEEIENYYVVFDSTAVTDLAGNSFSDIVSPLDWVFTTADLIDPILHYPSTNSAGAALEVSLTINEPVLAGSLRLVLSGAASRTITLSDLSVGSHEFTINPAEPLLTSQVQSMSGGSTIPDGEYDIELTHKDLTGSVTFSVTNTSFLLDTVIPSITGRSPSNNASGVSVDQNLQLVFDEPAQFYSGTITIKRLSDGATVEVIDVATGLTSGSGTDTLTINPFNDLEEATAYYIEASTGAIRDLVGNQFGGISGNSAWRFSTEGDDNGRVSVTPQEVTLTEGESQRIGILLQEPIIGDTELTLAIASSDDNQVTVGTETVTHLAASWQEARDFLISTVDDATVNGTREVEVTLTASSGSEFYNGYVQTVTLTILDNDVAPASPSTTTNPGRGGEAASQTLAPREAANEGTNEATDEAPAEQQAKIMLNDFPEFTNGQGKQMDMKVGQVLYFKVNSQEHTATIKEIGNDYVIVTIASTPQDLRLTLDKTTRYDVDQDGTADIEIMLDGITNGVASITFKDITDKVSQPISSNDTALGRATNWLFWLIVGGGLLFMFVIVVVGRHWSSKDDRPSHTF